MLIKAILVTRTRFQAAFLIIPAFSHQTRIFHYSRPCFVPLNLTHPTFTAKRYLYYTVKFAKNKRAFSQRKLPLGVKKRDIFR